MSVSAECDALAKLIELQKGKLYWAPNGMSSEDVQQLRAWRLVVDEEPRIRFGKYGVCHFLVEHLAAFGPLGIDQIVVFCRLCEEKLKEHERVVVVATNGSGTTSVEASLANLAVLIGAWFVLYAGHTAASAASQIGAHAQLRFPCSWARTPHTSPSGVTPADCFAGLEVAKDRGWLDLQSFDLGAYENELMLYDSCWLVPDEILVGADPKSTVRDPDPRTCTALAPCSTLHSPTKTTLQSPAKLDNDVSHTEPDAIWNVPQEEHHYVGNGQRGYKSGCGTQEEPHIPPKRSPSQIQNIEIPDTPTSLSPLSPQKNSSTTRKRRKGGSVQKVSEEIHQPMLSPCKANGEQQPMLFRRDSKELIGALAPDFTSFLLSRSVKITVRANMSDEGGLREIGGSYDPSCITTAGMEFLDAPFPDFGNCLPPPALLRKVLKRCEELDVPSARAAAFFHCKSGFGRSMMYACALLCSKYDVPGNALLGWVRLVRPGSVNSVNQERFLRSLNGSREVNKYLASENCCLIL